MQVNLLHRALALVSMLTLISGCSTMGEENYSCPGMPDGITCADPITVYDHSNDLEDLERLRQSKEAIKKEKERVKSEKRGNDVDMILDDNIGILPYPKNSNTENSTNGTSSAAAFSGKSVYASDDAQPGQPIKVTAMQNGKKVSGVYQSYINQKQLIVGPESPLPILQPAEVARIWIAPWMDDNQDLHWPGYIFTEITPRRWAFGENAVGTIKPVLPVLIDNGQTSKKRPNKRRPSRRNIRSGPGTLPAMQSNGNVGVPAITPAHAPTSTIMINGKPVARVATGIPNTTTQDKNTRVPMPPPTTP
jgi:conjugal transfer pilus assembly protein TraV